MTQNARAAKSLDLGVMFGIMVLSRPARCEVVWAVRYMNKRLLLHRDCSTARAEGRKHYMPAVLCAERSMM